MLYWDFYVLAGCAVVFSLAYWLGYNSGKRHG